MSALPKEAIRDILKQKQFNNAGEVMAFLKDAFKDVLQEMLEAEMVSKITERILPKIREWQNRPLEKIYPFIFMDAVHYKDSFWICQY